MKNETARREIESLDYYLQNHTDDYSEESHTAMMMAVKALGQEPCEDAISREWLKNAIHNFYYGLIHIPTEEDIQAYIDAAPPVNPQPKTGHCKDCKYFEYDSVANVDGVPLIVAHEICSRWGDGDIDDNLYTRLFDNGDEYVADMRRACVAIRKGKLIPKGHGRLIDADELYGDFIDGTEGYDCQTWNRIEIGDIIEDAPTIIESDKESEGV